MTPTRREPWELRLAEGAFQDARFAFRSLRRRPLFSVVAVATLALGIGGTTAIFSVVDAVLVKRLPFRDPETLVSVWRAWPSWQGQEVLDYVWDHIQFAVEDYLALRDGNSSFTAVEAAVHRRLALTLDGKTEEVGVGYATGGLFDLIGVRPILGRAVMVAPGERRGEPPSVEITVESDEFSPSLTVLCRNGIGVSRYHEANAGGRSSVTIRPLIIGDTDVLVIVQSRAGGTGSYRIRVLADG